ncbi:dTDP-4-dehydrorhamnose 3,5-epimerase family protein [Methylobacterium sp. A49B]
MRIIPTEIAGVMRIELEPIADDRGLFARTFCAEAFAAHGLATHFPHMNLSWNRRARTLRGLHVQAAPRAEAKLIRATRGRAYDVAVDLRQDSPSFRRWTAVELDADRRNAVYIPEGCAHGFLTLGDDCELLYLMSEVYDAGLARVARWNDPAFGIRWPATPDVIAPRDAEAPDFLD